MRSRDEGPGVIQGQVYIDGDQTVFLRGGYLVPRLVGWLFLAIVLILTFMDWTRAFKRRRVT